MGYHVRLVGTSDVERVSPINQDDRKQLYQLYGKQGIVSYKDTVGFSLYENVVWNRTATSDYHSFQFAGSWGAATFRNFINALENFAFSQGLTYSGFIPVGFCMFTTFECKKYAKELEEILKLREELPAEFPNSGWIEEFYWVFATGAKDGVVFSEWE